MNTEELINKWSPVVTLEQAYKQGYDCGKNGPTQTNCSFTLFQSPEHTKEWERGRDKARAEGAESAHGSQSTDSRGEQ